MNNEKILGEPYRHKMYLFSNKWKYISIRLPITNISYGKVNICYCNFDKFSLTINPISNP